MHVAAEIWKFSSWYFMSRKPQTLDKLYKFENIVHNQNKFDNLKSNQLLIF